MDYRLQTITAHLEAAERYARSIAVDTRLPKILQIQTDPAWREFIQDALDKRKYDQMFKYVRQYIALAERCPEEAELWLDKAEAILQRFSEKRRYLAQMVATWDYRHMERSRHQRSDAGRKCKRKKWAITLANVISSWEDIPESTCPLEIEGLERDFLIYRDGDTVCCVDGSTGQAIGNLKRSTFQKNYLGKQKKRGK